MSPSRFFFGWFPAVALALLSTGRAPAQVITKLHDFGGPGDGRNPSGSLLLDPAAGAFYGMTSVGPGFGNNGTIFRMNTDGTNFVTLHVFTGAANDGATPNDSLVQVGSSLYGLTQFGGSSGHGTIFKTNTDGTGFQIIHSFAGGPNDGASPLGTLTVVGSTLYGMTSSGGSVQGANGLYQMGTVFRLNLDGSGYNVLHNFGGVGDGSGPHAGALAVSGSTVYGATIGGGSGSAGTVFRMNLDGTGYGIIHNFVGGANDGAGPLSQVVISGTTIYGTTAGGGPANLGTLYKMQADGSGFAFLHALYGSPGDGSEPNGEPTISGPTVFATAGQGGANALGAILGVNSDASNYGVVYSFAGAPADGNGPTGQLTQVGDSFYGMTVQGGLANDGTIYSFTPVPEPSAFALLIAGAVATACVARHRRKCRSI